MFDADLEHGVPSNFLSLCQKYSPKVFLVLGSCFGPLAQELTPIQSWPFSAFHGMPVSSVAGHKGILTLGCWGKFPLLVAEGRIHFYEGHSRSSVTCLTRMAALAGCKTALLTNAAGGIHPNLGPGKIMLIDKHMVLARDKSEPPGGLCQIGSPYHEELLKILEGQSGKTECQRGTYLMVTGPNYETPSEIRFFQALGASAVGMSTAWEAEEANRQGLICAGISGITNWGAGIMPGPLKHAEVLEKAGDLCGKLRRLLTVFFHSFCI
ncbi:MAG: purine-nucleoside phosphorylase [Gemmataceae bacterium]|nr:purine-nucleoside phosphorylase [Gemmataceae bacterium]